MIDSRKEFIGKVTELFMLHGAKALTMDDIAKEFSMSKKTLYQYYKNKEDLLLEILKNISETFLLEVEKASDKHTCAIEILLVSNQRMNEIIGEKKNTFLVQLQKYYPEVFLQHQKNTHSGLANVAIHNFEKGIEQGIYRSDLPKELYVKFLLTLYFAVESSPLFEEEFDRDCTCIEILNFYLNAIVTEKGQQRLNELKTKYEKTD